MSETIKLQILEFLKKNTELISPKKLSEKLNISYHTILKYVDILFAEGRIELKDFGNVKLIKLKGD